jgi:two-component system sensor histidine kinase PilS (NtrC family)
MAVALPAAALGPLPTSALRGKLRNLIAIRAVISTVLLGSATFAQITSPGSLPADPFFFLIGLTYGLTALYAVTLRQAERHRSLVDLQLVGDVLIISAFIYFTGGITSYFSSLYLLAIVAAATVQFRRGGLLVAGLSALLYGAVVLVQYFTAAGLLHDPWLVSQVLPPRSVAEYTYSLNTFGFIVVGLLSGSLAEGMRSAGAQLVQASTTIADLQALNQHVIDSLPSGLATTDKQGLVQTFNRAAEFITGRPTASVIGRSIGEVLQLSEQTLGALTTEVSGSRPRRMEAHYLRDGQSLEIGLSAANIETPDGRAGYLFTFQDVTEFKKLERDARLQQRLAAVGEMAAGIAHEIRNPLASMSGSIQILRHELPLSAEQEQLMDIVLRESERLNTTIGSFLAYARPQRFAIERFDVRRALNDAALLLRNSADVQNDHVIDVDVPATALWYEADEGQIKQIVWNLATNGLRAMPSGGRLLLKAEMGFDGVVITVRDEGVGIPASELDGLFQPFHGRFVKGSGLGLAIVHRIVTDYNGEIQVNSQPGSGTTVAVHLPARALVTT